LTLKDEISYARNYGIAKSVHTKLRDAVYDVLFDLNMEGSIYISNESEASALANALAVSCCNTLDKRKFIKWEIGEKPASYDTRLDDAMIKRLEAS